MTTTLRKPQPKRKRAKKVKPLPTIWEVSDDLWQRIRPVLEEFWPTKATGRHHASWRKALNGIIFRMRSGCQWEQLPRKFGPKSTVHDWFQRWCQGGVMERIWAVLVADCDELGGVDWQWQSADAALGKARFGGEKDGQESHGSRQDGHEEVGAGRWPRRAAGGDDRRGQRPGAEGAPGHDRGGGGRAAGAGGRGPGNYVEGWGWRDTN